MPRPLAVTRSLAVLGAALAAVPGTAAGRAGDADLTFGPGGRVLARTGFQAANAFPAALVRRADGSVVVVSNGATTSRGQLAASAFDAGGVPLLSYGDAGIALVPAGRSDTTAVAGAGLPDGRVVMLGAATDGFRAVAAVVRLTPTGRPDPTFDGDGARLVRLGAGHGDPGGVAVTADGGTVLAGVGRNAVGAESLVVARLRPDGSPDAAFGSAGARVLPVADIGSVTDVLVGPGGRIVVVAAAFGQVVVARLTPAGALDPTFDGDGLARYDAAGDTGLVPGRAVIDAASRVLVAVTTNDFVGPTLLSHMALLRLTAAGAPDATWSAGIDPGLRELSVGIGSEPDATSGRAVALDDDGRIWLVGGAVVGGASVASAVGFAAAAPFGVSDKAYAPALAPSSAARQAFSTGTGADARLLVSAAIGGAGGPRIGLVRFRHGSAAPDATWSGDGLVTRAIGSDIVPGVTLPIGAAAAGGRTVIAGIAGVPLPTLVLHARGAGGGVVPGFASASGGWATIPARHPVRLRRAPDGRLVVVGYERVGTDDCWAIWRFRADGTADPTFAGSGARTVCFPTDHDGNVANDVVFLSDGGLLVVGQRGEDAGARVAALRLSANGSTVPTYGTGGLSVGQVGDAGGAQLAVALPDGGALLGGVVASGTNAVLAVVRLDADGVPVPAFGDGAGRVLVQLGTGPLGARLGALLRRPDGRIVLAGGMGASGGPAVLVRLLTDGRRDASFGPDGIRADVLPPGPGDIEAAALDRFGRVVAGATVTTPLGRRLAVLRYRASGSLDPTFGTGGVALRDAIGSRGLSAVAVLPRPDGRIALVAPSGGDVAIDRLLGDLPRVAGVRARRGAPGRVRVTLRLDPRRLAGVTWRVRHGTTAALARTTRWRALPAGDVVSRQIVLRGYAAGARVRLRVEVRGASGTARSAVVRVRAGA